MEISNDTTGTAATDSGAEIAAPSEYQGTEVAIMNDTTTQATDTAPAAKPAKAPKAPKVSKAYPFLTKAQIKASIETDFAFACLVITTLFDRQTAHEQDTKSTLTKNRRGFMSSHAVHGSRIALLVKAGAPVAAEDVARIQEIAPRYTKQMAEHFRNQALEANPELAAQSACYFTAQ